MSQNMYCPTTHNVDWATFIDKIYPVGAIYSTVAQTTAAQVKTALGGVGTWVAWGSGRVPVGVDTSDSSFNTVEKTGGSKTQTLSLDNLPKHRFWTGDVDSGYYDTVVSTNVNSGQAYGFKYVYAGRNTAHNNLQPYITCYMWKRTA